MNNAKTKKLWLLAGVLAVLCLITFGVSRIEHKKEDVQINGSTILSIPVSTVTSFSLDQLDGPHLSFHKEGDHWINDDDKHFPASTQKIEHLLEQFEDFSAGFTIDDVKDLGQYGLDKPNATLTLKAGEKEYTIKMGNFSKMDNQRYVSIGDDKVYLAIKDPMDTLDVSTRELIQNVSIPSFDDVTSITFAGDDNYTIQHVDEGGVTYRPEDVWFAKIDGNMEPLDPDSVDDYISSLSTTFLGNYSKYYVDSKGLSEYGLDKPELTITVHYLDNDNQAGTFTLYVSRDPKELKAAENENQEKQGDHPITAYARVEGSDIVYILDSGDYDKLSVYQFNDLRHKQVLPANVEDISQVEFYVDHTPYLFTSSGTDDQMKWKYNEIDVNAQEFEKALTSVTVNQFTDEKPANKLELSYKVTLKDDDQTELKIEIYRYDGDNCLAVVDGSPVGLVTRSKVVDLTETINSIVLNTEQRQS